MKLLYLNHNVAGSGTYQRAFNLAREMRARGHDVTLVTTSRELRLNAREHVLSGVHVIEAPDLLVGRARNGWDGWNASWRTRRLAHEHFDLVHAFDCRPAVIVPALAQTQRNRAALFLDWADWWGRGGTIQERSGWAVRTFFGPVETWFEEHFRTRAMANTTISEPLRERCIALGVAPERVIALPNGCTPPAPARDRAEARRVLRFGDEPVALHLGVMQRADAAFLLSAFRALREHAPRVRLVLLGRCNAAVPHDLRRAVTVTGYVDNDTLATWLAAADIGVIPLRDTLASRARWPGKINEYFSAGLPVVLPGVGAAAAYVRTHGTGITCAAEPAAFAAAMATALQDESARARMAKAARALATGDLAWPRLAQRLDEFYRNQSHGSMQSQRITVGAS